MSALVVLLGYAVILGYAYLSSKGIIPKTPEAGLIALFSAAFLFLLSYTIDIKAEMKKRLERIEKKLGINPWLEEMWERERQAK